MSHPLRVAQLNTRASILAWSLGEKVALENGVGVFLIQDPPKDAKHHPWANFSLVLPWNGNPLVVILIKKGIKFRFEGWGSSRVI